MRRHTLVPFLSIVLAACAGQPPAPTVSVPDNLKPAANESLASVVAARGVQIYECRVKKDDPSATEWAFVAPEAELFDSQGKPLGKHYAGPHWEHSDGSKIVGVVKSRADAPQAGAIPWLLLTTKSVGAEGAFAKVTTLQRINTVGGVAPAAGCSATTLGQTARVPYSADYVMYAAK